MSAVQEPPPAGTARTTEEYPDSDPQLFYELAKSRLETQLSTIDAVDNKLGLLVSLASALMGILVAVIAIRGNANLDAGDYAALSVSGAFYLAAAGLSIYAYFVRDWSIGPKLDEIWGDLHDPEEDDNLLKWKVAADFWGNYRDNEAAQRCKTWALPWVLVAVTCQTVALVVGLALVAAA